MYGRGYEKAAEWGNRPAVRGFELAALDTAGQSIFRALICTPSLLCFCQSIPKLCQTDLIIVDSYHHDLPDLCIYSVSTNNRPDSLFFLVFKGSVWLQNCSVLSEMQRSTRHVPEFGMPWGKFFHGSYILVCCFFLFLCYFRVSGTVGRTVFIIFKQHAHLAWWQRMLSYWCIFAWVKRKSS